MRGAFPLPLPGASKETAADWRGHDRTLTHAQATRPSGPRGRCRGWKSDAWPPVDRCSPALPCAQGNTFRLSSDQGRWRLRRRQPHSFALEGQPVEFLPQSQLLQLPAYKRPATEYYSAT